MTDTTTTDRGTARSRQRRRRKPIIARRRRRAPLRLDRTTAAALALHELINHGEFVDAARGRSQYLIVTVSPDLMELISIGLAASEDDEEGGDMEPSVDGNHDLEYDGLENGYGGLLPMSNESDAGRPEIINQAQLSGSGGGTCDDEENGDREPDEHADCTWQNEGCQLKLLG